MGAASLFNKNLQPPVVLFPVLISKEELLPISFLVFHDGLLPHLVCFLLLFTLSAVLSHGFPLFWLVCILSAFQLLF